MYSIGELNAHDMSPAATSRHSSGPSLLSLPVEIRLEIYSLLFGQGKAMLNLGNRPHLKSFIPGAAFETARAPERSSQLLRTCQTILHEAQPLLYATTTFHVLQHVFAGSLPTSFSDGHGGAKYMKHVVWQLECDLLKRWYAEDLQFQSADEWGSLQTLEIRCRADQWCGSYHGEKDERAEFANGREQVVNYGAWLLQGMGNSERTTFLKLSEDRRYNGKGEVRIKLARGTAPLDSEVSTSVGNPTRHATY